MEGPIVKTVIMGEQRWTSACFSHHHCSETSNSLEQAEREWGRECEALELIEDLPQGVMFLLLIQWQLLAVLQIWVTLYITDAQGLVDATYGSLSLSTVVVCLSLQSAESFTSSLQICCETTSVNHRGQKTTAQLLWGVDTNNMLYNCHLLQTLVRSFINLKMRNVSHYVILRHCYKNKRPSVLL